MRLSAAKDIKFPEFPMTQLSWTEPDMTFVKRDQIQITTVAL